MSRILARIAEARKNIPATKNQQSTFTQALTPVLETAQTWPNIPLAEIIVQIVAKYDWVTFAELPRRLEEYGFQDSQGDQLLKLGPNMVIWSGLSETLAAAIIRLQDEKRIHLWPATLLAYAADGGYPPDLPLIQFSQPSGDYQEPVWVPLCLRIEKLN